MSRKPSMPEEMSSTFEVDGKPYIEEQEKVKLAEDGTVPVLPQSLMANWELECTIERATRYREEIMHVHNVLTEMSGMQLGNPLEMTAVVSWSPV